MATIGESFINSALHQGDAEKFLKFGKLDHLFKGDVEALLFTAVQQHIQKYGKLPAIETFEQVTKHAVQAEAEPPEFHLDRLKNRYVDGKLKSAVNDASKFLEGAQPDPMKALESLLGDLTSVVVGNNSDKIYDFREALDRIYADYKAKMLGGDDYGIKMGWPTLDEMTGGLIGGDLVSIVGRPAQGKAQPLDSMVLTVDGWKRMGDLKVGQGLASSDGQPSSVTGIYPQGPKQVYAVMFMDGRKVECCGEHLWRVHSSKWPDGPRVISTLEIGERLMQERFRGRLGIELISGEVFAERPLPMDPWLLGVLLGDGCFKTELCFSSADQEIVRDVGHAIQKSGYMVIHRSAYDYAIVSEGTGSPTNLYKALLKRMSLWGLGSHEKFIPEVYKTSSVDQRVALLRGLLDTDGTVGKDGQITYCTTSPRLADDVQNLVWSLGGLCSRWLKKTSGFDAHQLCIRLRQPDRLFSLERKRGRLAALKGVKKFLNTIGSVEPIRVTECQCISVSHPNRQYVTTDYVLTHNTWFLLFSALMAWYVYKKPVAFISMEMAPLLIEMRLAAMQAHISATQIKNADLTTKALAALMACLKDIKNHPVPFYVIDGVSTPFVRDATAICRQLGVAAAWVDGAYLFKHPTEKDRYRRVAENVDLLKFDMAAKLQIPVTASWQFAKTGAKSKLKQGEKAGLDDIAYSDAIGQHSSIVIGLLEEDGVTTITTRRADILKGRSGEVGFFETNWNFHSMDFTELPKADFASFTQPG